MNTRSRVFNSRSRNAGILLAGGLALLIGFSAGHAQSGDQSGSPSGSRSESQPKSQSTGRSDGPAGSQSGSQPRSQSTGRAEGQAEGPAEGPAGSQSESQAGVIAGRVVNGDGSGAAKVAVSIRAAGETRPGVAQTVTTDENGNFRFTNLPPRSYHLSASGEVGSLVMPDPSIGGRMPTQYHVGDNVTLTLVKGGVITGRVTNAAGEPVIGIQVSALMKRDSDGNPIRLRFTGNVRFTDDRGIYRLYGLLPGSYLVVVNGRYFYGSIPSPYEGETGTYYPSSTVDTAGEIIVANGGEVTGADIRYHGERGHVISGKVAGIDPSSGPFNSSVSVMVYSITTGAAVSSVVARPDENQPGYAISGVPDGEYEVIAMRGGYEGAEGVSSQPRRITVKGADVTGVDIKMMPVSSVSGKIVLSAASDACRGKAKPSIEEFGFWAKPGDQEKAGGMIQAAFSSGDVPVNEKGEFSIRSLNPGLYRVGVRMPNESWYPTSIVASASTAQPGAQPGRSLTSGSRLSGGTDVSRTGIRLNPGERVSGLVATVANGAASVQGTIAVEGGARRSSRVRVYLIPSENTAADDLLRYAETIARQEGTFTFANLAPGRYRLLTRPISDDEPVDRPLPPLAWNPAERAKLRREAEALNQVIELRPCQQLKDYVLGGNH